MKIAYICADIGIPIYGYKGSSVHVREIVGAWRRLGHEVVIFSPRTEKQQANGHGHDIGHRNHHVTLPTVTVPLAPLFHKVAEELEGLDAFLGMRHRVMQDLRNFWYNRTLFDTLEPHLAREGFDFVYERYTIFTYAGVALARRFDIPHILEVNAPLCYEKETIVGLEMKHLAQALEQRTFTESDCVAVVSEQLRDFAIAHGVAPERVQVLPNGVNVNTFRASNEEAAEMRINLGLPDHATIVGFVGSLKPWHGVHTLVDAIHQLRERNRSVHLLLVGDGPERAALEAQIDALGLSAHVTITGKIDHTQIPAAIAVMDITVAPYTQHDNFYFSPIKIFEYMAIGKPVIASAIGQVSQIMETGKNGLLYSPGDSHALAQAIEKLDAQPHWAQEMGAAGQEWVLQNRTWDGNAVQVINIAKDLLASRTTSAVAPPSASRLNATSVIMPQQPTPVTT